MHVCLFILPTPTVRDNLEVHVQQD